MKKKIILTRTVPMDIFLKISKEVEHRFAGAEIVLLLQESVVARGDVPSGRRFLVVPDGMLTYAGLSAAFKDKLAAENPDVFIIASKILYGPGYEELISLGKSTTAAHVLMISQYLGVRDIRRNGEDVPLDEGEIAKLSAEDVRSRFDGASYYDNVESSIDRQWRDTIFPLVKDGDFARVLELAPGHGRNTAKLMEISGEILLVDANKSCIDFCKERFKSYRGPCRLSYHVNDGRSLEVIQDNSVSFIYSWDSMVHFDKFLMREYVREFNRVLRPGGTGFVHHSNYGNQSAQANFSVHVNPHGRSNMTRELFKEYCAETGLEVLEQKIIDWGVKDLDCLSLFKKGDAAVSRETG